MFSEFWFERALFTWGWLTASVAQSLALLRIIDPKLESETLEDYGVAYIAISPIEVAVVTLAPAMIAAGLSLLFAGGTVAIGVGALVLAWSLGWWAGGRRTAD